MLFVDSLLTAPLPNLLIVLGAFFVLLAVVSKLATNTPLGTVDADGKGRMVAAVVGPLLIVMGLLVIPAVAPADPPDDGPTLVNGTVGTLTPPADDVTPPEQLTETDRTVTATPSQATPIPPDPTRTLVELEPNDAALSATLVEGGVTIAGEVRSTYDPDPSMDSDYYAVWVDAGDTVTVDVTRDAGPGTVYVALLDPDGLPEPSGDWLADVMTVQGGERVRIDTVATRSGYHYVVVTGWVYLVDYDLYFNDGGNGGYVVDIGAGADRASVDGGDVSAERDAERVLVAGVGAGAATLVGSPVGR
jgi:hypothetical protein